MLISALVPVNVYHFRYFSTIIKWLKSLGRYAVDNISLVKTVQILPTQIAIAAFFAMGFVTTYYWLWRRALVTTPKARGSTLPALNCFCPGLD